MTCDKLMFNDGKTEIALFGTSQQLQKVTIDKIKVGDADDIYPADVVKDLGVSGLTLNLP